MHSSCQLYQLGPAILVLKMKSLFGMLRLWLRVMAVLAIGHSVSGGQDDRCIRYNAEKTPLVKLEGEWYVQDYANAGNAFENQTCVRIGFYTHKNPNTATFIKTWVDKWTKVTEFRELLVEQVDPTGIVFLNSSDQSWKIDSTILRLTNDGTFIHSSCELIGTTVRNERITTATRKRKVNRRDWLDVYNSLGNSVFQNHSEVSQENCIN